MIIMIVFVVVMLIESGGADGSVCGSDLVRSGDGSLCGASAQMKSSTI